MANAIKQISVQRGHDVTEYTLCCFGGAGGQHACLVADALGMTRVFIHPLAGVLSAYGMGLADITAMREQAVEVTLDDRTTGGCSKTRSNSWRSRRGTKYCGQGVPPERVRVVAARAPQYDGTDSALIVDFGTIADMVQQFESGVPQALFASSCPSAPLLAEAVSVEAIGMSDAPERGRAGGAHAQRPAASGGYGGHAHAAASRTARRYSLRDTLQPGDQLAGPAIIAEANATTVVEPGWQAEVTPLDHLVLQAHRGAPDARRHRHHASIR